MPASSAENTYVVATLRPWNITLYHDAVPTLPGHWHLITTPEQLTLETLKALNPRYVFFPHWSHKVPNEILDAFECVCFHMTDVPYGRGGSPLQNLIARGKTETVVSALRMSDVLDAGPVYAKKPLSLQGLAEEIYLRAAAVIFSMIRELVVTHPVPQPQTGEAVTFARRTPAQSEIPVQLPSLDALFDHLRMLDAEGYPPAFIEYGGFRLAFTQPARRTGHVAATVTITPLKSPAHEQ